MKKILKQIEQIKGVVKVMKIGDRRLIVNCQPDNEPIIITEDGVPLFNKKDPCWWVNIDSLMKGRQKAIIPALNDDDYFRYFSTKAAAKEFIKMEEAVSDLQDRIAMDLVPASAYTTTSTLTADQLKDGEIFVDLEGCYSPRIVRFKKTKGRYISIYSQLLSDNMFSGYLNKYAQSDNIRPATPAEAQSLIRAEVANNYFHGINTTV